MKKNDFIELLFNVTTELFRETEFIRSAVIDYDNMDFGHVADYWRKESKSVEKLRLRVLNELIPFLRGIQGKGGDEE